MYWRWDSIRETTRQNVELVLSDDVPISDDDFIVRYAAGDQLRKVEVGDILWIVSVEPESGDLVLFGRIQVGWCGEVTDATRILGRDDLWEAGWSVIAKEGTEEHFELIPLLNEAAQLRFVSKTGQDHLTIKNGRVSPQQLQTVRLLTKESADLLEAIWNNPEQALENVREAARSGATGLLYELLMLIDALDEKQVKVTDSDHGEELLEPEDTLEFLEVIEDEVAYTEGQPVQRTRWERQRNKVLIEQAKRKFLALHGRLYCEVCGFDFADAYGELGEGYIEAHHVRPISGLGDQGQQTSLDDLVMLCADCHRMIHRQKPPLTIEELKRHI